MAEKLLMINEKAIEAVKQAMGYTDGDRVCGVCSHFTPTDCSGSPSAMRSNCSLNAFVIEVSEKGTCNHFEVKPKAQQSDFAPF